MDFLVLLGRSPAVGIPAAGPASTKQGDRMKRWQIAALAAGVVAAVVSVTVPTAPASASDDDPYTFAVIGDIPYGSTAIVPPR